MIELLHKDCMELLKDTPDKFYDLAIVDPPYRDNNQPTKDMRLNGSMKSLEGRPNKKYWDELFRVSKEQIIWGANNFQLPQFKGFVVWKKKTISEDFTMSMCEIASLSENLSTVSKWIEIAPQGTKEDTRIHPTQKPVKLYEWLLLNYTKENDKILDTHGGSMSIALAVHNVNQKEKMNLSLTLTELNEDYYKSGVKRYQNHIKQKTIFDL